MSFRIEPKPGTRGLPRFRDLGLRWQIAIVAGVIALGLIYWSTRHSTTSPATVAAAANAVSCDNSGFQIESQLTGHKTTIYDCTFAPSGTRCVSYENGVANDITAEVRIVFANAFSSKPSCLS